MDRRKEKSHNKNCHYLAGYIAGALQAIGKPSSVHVTEVACGEYPGRTCIFVANWWLSLQEPLEYWTTDSSFEIKAFGVCEKFKVGDGAGMFGFGVEVRRDGDQESFSMTM